LIITPIVIIIIIKVVHLNIVILFVTLMNICYV